MEQWRPPWIGIDCGNEAHMDWLPPLVESALQRHIPVVVWTQNPFSDCVSVFARHGHVFAWPFLAPSAMASHSERNGLEAVLCNTSTTTINPLLMQQAGDTFTSNLSEARRVLCLLAKQPLARLQQDAVRSHWQYLNALESLAVPCQFFETEAAAYWGVRLPSRLSKTCVHFQEACFQQGPMSAEIDPGPRCSGCCPRPDPRIWSTPLGSTTQPMPQ